MNAFSIPGQEATAIMQEMIEAMFARIPQNAENVLLDGTFPGSQKLPARQRWQKYLEMTDVADLPLLQDDGYLKAYQDGLALAPVSPKWRSAISIPSLFKKMRSDFLSLQKEFGGDD